MRRDERGQMGVTLLLSVSIAVTFFTLAFDVGLWAYDHRWAQTQADAAAHAAVIFLPSTDRSVAENARDQWLAHNGSNPTENTCPQEVLDDVPDPGNTGEVIFDTVRVCIGRQTRGYFSPLARIAGVNVSASAAARVSGFALMALHGSACPALYASESVEIVVRGGGGSYTGSSGSSCPPGQQPLQVRGNASFVTTVNDVVGGWAKDPSATLLAVPTASVAPLRDPYEILPQPSSVGGQCVSVIVNGGDHVTLPPGRYCGLNQTSTNSTVTLSPGLGPHIFVGPLTVTGGAFTSNDAGVLIYMTCPSSPCNGDPPGDLLFGDSAVVHLRGLASAGDMVIWADRTAGLKANGTPHVMQIDGNNATALNGRVYGVHSHIRFGGTSNANVALNASVVAGTLALQGNNRFSFLYNAAQTPPSHQIAIIE